MTMRRNLRAEAGWYAFVAAGFIVAVILFAF